MLTEEFQNDLPAVLSKVTIPSKYNPDNVDVEIVDTNGTFGLLLSDYLGDEFPEGPVSTADVIILVYSVLEQVSYDQVVRYWLPKITQVNLHAPIVVVGNKIDCREKAIDDSELELRIAPIMREFRQVETCVESSAKQMVNIAEIFYFALKSVLFPTSTLYDASLHVSQGINNSL